MLLLSIFLCICFLLLTYLYIDFNKARRLHKFDVQRTDKRIENIWKKFRKVDKKITSIQQEAGWDDSNHLTRQIDKDE